MEILSNGYFIQALGLVAAILSISAFWQGNDTRLKLLIGVAACITGVHFYLLGSLFGAVSAFMAGTRFLLSLNKKFDFLMPVFLIFYIGLAFVNGAGLISYLPILAGLLGTLAVFSYSGNKMRYIFLVCQSCWLVHNVYFMSIGGIIEQTFQICANIKTILGIRKNARLSNH